ncbi:MAG TPA: PASTA domain-containing protein [Nocardioides sp.]|nr:PASTA domain-containing protein [Nocardioides sp.]
MRAPALHRVLVVVAVAVGGLAVSAPPASAQATRTWVSGVGDDANPCSRTAPCKTWAGAISKTAVGGEIDAMDDAGYGTLTITKAITINGGGHLASTLASGTNGINIAAPVDAQVVLKNLDLQGMNPAEGTCNGLTGVNITSAAAVSIDNVAIQGFGTAVGGTLGSSSPDVFVDISINRSRIANNCSYGVHLAPAASHPGRLAMDDSTITGSNTALSVANGGEAWVSNSRIYLNNVGLQPVGTGKIHSYCNNQVAGNATDGAFTDNVCGGVPTSSPAAAYCTVPKLKKKTLSQASSALTAAGCTIGKVKKEKAARKNKGKVLEQAVPAGIQVKPGTAVAITIGK